MRPQWSACPLNCRYDSLLYISTELIIFFPLSVEKMYIRLLFPCHLCPISPPVLPLSLTYILRFISQQPWTNFGTLTVASNCCLGNKFAYFLISPSLRSNCLHATFRCSSCKCKIVQSQSKLNFKNIELCKGWKLFSSRFRNIHDENLEKNPILVYCLCITHIVSI